MANKFLIVNNKFLWSSSVKYHYELLPENVTKNKVAGGGWWFLDRKSKKFILFDKSEDFGYAKKEDIINALNRTLFPEYMDGVEFYITRLNSLDNFISEIKDKQIQPDWIYDDSSELIVDDLLPVTSSSNKESIFEITNNTPSFYKTKGTTIIKDKKVGRNDPCICLSGLKYKNCCLKHNLI